MRVGIPTEIKSDEYRVAITPAGVRELCARGHEVLIQAGAGLGSALSDEQFQAQGATIVADAQAVFAGAELILKVKEPQSVGGRAAARGPDALHISAPGGRAGVGRGSAPFGRHLHRL